MFDEIKRQIKLLEELPETIAYIVLDHTHSPLEPHIEGRDAQNRRYMIVSPSVLDGMRHQKYAGTINILSGGSLAQVASRLSAIPIYRREAMHVGWPDK